MSNPNALQPGGEQDPNWHHDAAAALLHFAAEGEVAVDMPEASAVEDNVVALPEPKTPKMTSWRAMEGTHPNWVGFSSKTGLPKVG